MGQQKTNAAANGAAEEMVDRLDQIREILFGNVKREHDSRFDEIFKAIQSLKRDTDRALEALSKDLRAELADARNDLSAAIDGLDGRLKESSAEGANALVEHVSALRGDLDKKTTLLTENIESKAAQAAKALDTARNGLKNELNALDQRAAPRAEVALILKELADRIAGPAGDVEPRSKKS